MRVLVTGGQGCIGAWVIRSLLRRGADVVMFDQEPEPTRLSLIALKEEIARIRIVTGKIEDTPLLKALVRNEEITHIVHLAAVLMPFCQKQPVNGALINVVGTLNLFEAARDAGRSVRVVYASSSAVWGPEEMYGGRILHEGEALHPATHYGVFKHANEGNARVFYTNDGISSVGLRPWTVYGVGRDTGLTADPTLAIRALAKDESFRIRLSGFMDLQYVADVAEIFVRCLLSSVEGAHVFNLAGEVVEMNDFIGLLEAIRPGARDLIQSEGPQVPVAFRMDDQALRTTMGEMPKTPLREGVLATYQGFRSLREQNRL